MNWYKKAQNQKWSWRRFLSTFGMTVILGMAAMHNLGMMDIQKLYAENPQKVIQMTEQYQSAQNKNTSSLVQNTTPPTEQAQPQTDTVPSLTQTIQEPFVEKNLIHDDLYETIKRHEGFSNTIYLDTKQIPTIGIGFNLLKNNAEQRLRDVGADPNEVMKGSPLSEEQIYALFQEDLKIAQQEASEYLPNFNEHPIEVRNILINMAFNLGKEKLLQFQTLRKNLLNKDYESAAKSMEKSKWYKQVGNRSKELVSIMRSMKKASTNWYKQAQEKLDAIGRPIPNWDGQIVYHATDDSGLQDMQKNGYRFWDMDEQCGYYGYAVHFAVDINYAKSFGSIVTEAKIQPNTKILNLNDPNDFDIFSNATKNKNGLKYRDIITSMGYDGVYDPGAGDLALYNPEKAAFIGIAK